ncbi:unnamed protein product, partial [Bubo scandiacus]
LFLRPGNFLFWWCFKGFTNLAKFANYSQWYSSRRASINSRCMWPSQGIFGVLDVYSFEVIKFAFFLLNSCGFQISDIKASRLFSLNLPLYFLNQEKITVW